jgi:hypothetical protein
VPQRDLSFLGNHQRQPQLAQIMPALLAGPSLCQLAARVAAVQVGKEVGRLIGDRAEPNRLGGEDLDQQPLFDLLDGRQGHAVHLIPEVLAGQGVGRDAEPLGERGLGGPGGDRPLAGGTHPTRDGGGQQRFAHAEPVAVPPLAARRGHLFIEDFGTV